MTMLARRLVTAALGLVLMASAACARGADAERVKTDLQERLNRDVKPDLFRVVAIKREGSAPTAAGESGASRVVVYFNATLELTQPYSFGSWDELGSSSVAYALGATEKGLFGLQPQNKAGDRVRAYGSAIYERAADGAWMPVEMANAPQTAAAEVPDIEGSAPPSRSKQLINRLAALVELPPPGRPVQEDAIIADELSRASDNIERRVQRREAGFTLATGPENGMYARFGGSIISALKELAPTIKIQERRTEGSVDNAFLLARGEVDYAIVQGDVAAAAVSGDDLFSRGQPLSTLRAVGGLFPEAIHIVVRPDSPVRGVADLRGRRVDIGTPSSGTRFDAVAVLAAYGLKPSDLAEARQDGLSGAIGRLRRGQIDALFATGAAPEPSLQALAAQAGLRLLPITAAALEQLGQARPGLVRLTLPVNTYPRQQSAVVTAASSALLLTTTKAPPAEVERVVDLVFTRMAQKGAGGAAVVKVSAANQLRGVTIPLHEGTGRTTPGEER